MCRAVAPSAARIFKMKIYKIRNWNELYENNRSRTVISDLRWVKIPNRFDGEHFSAIMTHKDGAVIFASWVLLVQVASRCQPRGSLLRDNKTPHNPLSLSLKTRAPAKWFETALDYLEKHTDWLEIEELAEWCQEADSQVAGGCQDGDPRSDKIREDKKRGEKSDAVASPAGGCDEEFIKGLEVNEAYRGINIRQELGKMVSWCNVNRKQPSQRRFINWINRVERPMTTQPHKLTDEEMLRQVIS